MTATGFRERTLPFICYPERCAGRIASQRGRLHTQLCWGQRLHRWGEVYQAISPFRNPFGGISWPLWDFCIFQKASWQPSSYVITPLCLDLRGEASVARLYLLSHTASSFRTSAVSVSSEVSLRTLGSPSEEGSLDLYLRSSRSLQPFVCNG